ncbi:hypothetical protein K426_00605 [Sphingobium sp. TKS]|uniref:type II toxin-antitoxin system RelE/ParE family toxin n=1 Tax=Sphingobium sp. TB-6 TaxID=2728850 RepID=UPI00077069F7|nr:MULTISPECIES: type II toxin-antitoxin system RelE/ParE family toxin [Sphingomonadaceae]AMK21085.1 hypothetical protein K426_00605 [Sphingobium sp. TKS]MEC6700495.1 type II toxin-antitoxin system RelE/ParE family toxin [Sphingobium sp. SJ10-10]
MVSAKTGNISKADVALLREAATKALKWNGEERDRLGASGMLVEIEDGDEG